MSQRCSIYSLYVLKWAKGFGLNGVKYLKTQLDYYCMRYRRIKWILQRFLDLFSAMVLPCCGCMVFICHFVFSTCYCMTCVWPPLLPPKWQDFYIYIYTNMREILCGTYDFLIYWSSFICALNWTLFWSELCFASSATLDLCNENDISCD